MAQFSKKAYPMPDKITASPYRGVDPVEMQKIDVILYGDGKSRRNSADIIYCSCPDKCSLYAIGKCMQHRKIFAPTDMCAFGCVRTVEGFTRRAASFSQFNAYIKDDPLYASTKGDFSFSLTKIDNTFAIRVPSIQLVKKEDGSWKVDTDSWGSATAWVPETELTVELIEKIVNARPRSIFGDVIRSYQTDAVPKFLENMQKLAPELYSAFVAANPDYAGVVRNNVGRLAYIKTLAEGTVLKIEGNTWTVCDGKLVGKNVQILKGFLPLGRANEIILDIDDNAKIEVKDNAWCDKGTVFTDM